MAFSTDIVYKTLFDFFNGQLNQDIGSESRLRFGQSRYSIPQQDYSSANKALESFSKMVNQVPVEKGGGVIFFSGTELIDETYYYNILLPSTVENPANAPSFGLIKDKAEDLYDKVHLGTSDGMQTVFRPSHPAPSDWYSRTDSGFWTNKSFTLNDPTIPPPNNSLVIAFDYAKVDISREWWFEPFLTNKTWHIEGKYKGELTSYRKDNTNLVEIPVSIIIIRNLIITGTSGMQPGAFGPFIVDTTSADHLTFSGIQVIGWILKKLPPLPPIGDDSLPDQHYSLIDNANSATWTSFLNPPGFVVPAAQINNFVWSQPNYNDFGSANIDTNVRLEDGFIYNALRTFPMSGTFGAIKGYYTPFTLNGKGRFRAKIGFAYNGYNPQLSQNILFQVAVFYPVEFNKQPQIIVNEFKSYDGHLKSISVDLSAFENQEIAICLFVGCNSPSIAAAAYWVTPIIDY